MVWLEDKRKLYQSQCTPNRSEKVKVGQWMARRAEIGPPVCEIAVPARAV
jgi:hypothetical protein